MLKRLAVLSFFTFFIILAGIATAGESVQNSLQPVKIYKNGGCNHCTPYLAELMEMLTKNGYRDIVISDYMLDEKTRKEVYEIQESYNVPLEMRGHMVVLIGNDYLFEGHVPATLIENYLKNPKGRIIVTQDKMDSPKSYLMFMDGKPHTCDINMEFADCIAAERTALGENNQLLNLAPIGLLLVAGAFGIYALKGK